MLKKINLKAFQSFIKSTSSGGIILIVCVILALMIANSPLSSSLENILQAKMGFSVSEFKLEFPILLWINDGLMAIFFLYVGLEIKRELVEGELSSVSQAALPALAALGGVIFPAFIYFLFNYSDQESSRGWGIPMATDIAFAIGILSLLGKRVPSSLKIFLSALAIVDDLMAILVIAFFYSTHVELSYLLYSGGILLLLTLFNRIGITHLAFYLIPGIFMWYFIHHSGIHATISGVLTAMTIPTNKGSKASPLEKLEHHLNIPVSYFILPIFAFVNTNIRFEEGMEKGLVSSMGLGIVLGLFLGKPLGITLTCWAAVQSGISKLPNFATWRHMIGLGLLGGIGFTMSIFVAILSFDNSFLQSKAKFCILIASLLSGLFGYFYLKKQPAHQPQ